MKVMIRRDSAGKLSVYVPKKDLEEPVVEQEKDDLWGGTVRLANGTIVGLDALGEIVPTTAFLAIWTSRAELESLTMPLALLSLVAPALAFVAYRTDVDTVVHEISLAVTTPSAP